MLCGKKSCARISSASTPATTRKISAYPMYSMPILLWSTVTTQLVDQPPGTYPQKASRASGRAPPSIRLGTGMLGVAIVALPPK